MPALSSIHAFVKAGFTALGHQFVGSGPPEEVRLGTSTPVLAPDCAIYVQWRQGLALVGVKGGFAQAESQLLVSPPTMPFEDWRRDWLACAG